MDKIKYEQILVDLLGLNIVETNDECFQILDEDNKLVGYVKKVKVFNSDEGSPITFNFRTDIKTDTISFTSSRRIDKFTKKDNLFEYNIDIIEKNQIVSKKITLNLGEKPNIVITDKNDDTIKFQVEYDRLYFSYYTKLKDKKYENIIVEIKNYNSGIEYNYNSTITDQRKQLQGQSDKKSYKLFVKNDPVFKYELIVKEQKRDNGKIIKSIDFCEKGFDQTQIINQDVIQAFDSIKFLIEDYLPLNVNSIKSILKENDSKFYLSPFILERSLNIEDNLTNDKVKTLNKEQGSK